MCGICGNLSLRNNTKTNIIEGMMKRLAHRGPDDHGMENLSLFKEDDLGIGFVRLSIRDLSINGHQPMWNDSKTAIITFNGEIYNSEELRANYLSNENFVSTSDTEVLLKMYDVYGIDAMLPMLDGMFAFCIVDLRKKTIYLCRDRLGEKPLYYCRTDDYVMWASEYKAFYENENFKPELNIEALTEYLMFRYVSDGETLLKHVRNIHPGTYIRIDKNSLNEIRYWNIGGINTEKYDDFYLKHLLKKSIKRRIVSDVPVGIQLSGGVDSSLLAALLNDERYTFNSYGIIFDNRQFSEELYMRMVDTKLGISTNMIPFKSDDFLKLWIDTTYYFENPMNHEGTLALLLLNRFASNYNKVLLCGEGADELFGGYSWYGKYMYYLNSPIMGKLFRIKREGLDALAREMDEVFIKETQYIGDQDIKKIFPAQNIIEIIEKRKAILQNTSGKKLRRYMNYDMQTYMQDILMRGDKISMAASVELRIPYLMPELVGYITSCEDEAFVKSGRVVKMENLKMPLKRYGEKVYGKKFVYRDKKGFGIDLHDFMLQKNTKQYIEDVLLPSMRDRGLFDYKYIENEWRDEKKRDSINYKTMLLWIIISFELWAHMYLSGTRIDYNILFCKGFGK